MKLVENAMSMFTSSLLCSWAEIEATHGERVSFALTHQ